MILCLRLFYFPLSLSDGLHPSPCSVSLWQHQDGEVPPAATGQRQQQNKGECLPLVWDKTTATLVRAWVTPLLCAYCLWFIHQEIQLQYINITQGSPRWKLLKPFYIMIYWNEGILPLGSVMYCKSIGESGHVSFPSLRCMFIIDIFMIYCMHKCVAFRNTVVWVALHNNCTLRSICKLRLHYHL